ncbi:putative P-loop containing nucleoside triphosphate hydrolase [Helianthus annuus]|nr:putative P-loop containing nucleoside triphosphate hydrolase [Helianthus annuus]
MGSSYIPVDDYDYLFKVVLLGDSGVGKTNLLSRSQETSLVSSQNQPSASLSVVVAFKSTMKSQRPKFGTPVAYRGITSAYYRGTCRVLLVYDVTRHEERDKILAKGGS